MPPTAVVAVTASPTRSTPPSSLYAAQLQAGRLEQVCPTCELKEAAGGYCSWDLTPTGEARSYRPIVTDAQLANLTRARAAQLVGSEQIRAANQARSTGAAL
jgi:hypothetical protein